MRMGGAVRKFNTTGPVVPSKHYHIPPLGRVDLDSVLSLIHDEKYFILHAPRQTGKTSTLLALRDRLNSGTEGPYRCVYVNVESGQAAGEDVGRAMRTILGRLATFARLALADDFVESIREDVLESFGPDGALEEVLIRWASADARPLVLLIDEIDALVGDTLLSVLRQLRSSYTLRPTSFPQSVILCGVRNLRDYRIPSGSKDYTGTSAFNISARSLRLSDFTRNEVQSLLGQRTAESGQQFLPEAVACVWTQTQGQPWLVNALCERACFASDVPRDQAVTAADIQAAQEQLILDRVVHLDQLTDKLQEARVRRVIEPLLTGSDRPAFTDQDLEYVRDLGLIARDDPPRISNPIYAEAVPRHLTHAVQAGLPIQAAWYVDAHGGLDVSKLLEDFGDFFRQHSEHWDQRFLNYEAGPQLLLQAYLQKVINSGGQMIREYGLGRGRTDLLITWPRGPRHRRFVVECRVLRRGLESTIREGVEQTAGYVDRSGAQEGHLVVFDGGQGLWKEKLFRRRELAGDIAIEVWGM